MAKKNCFKFADCISSIDLDRGNEDAERRIAAILFIINKMYEVYDD